VQHRRFSPHRTYVRIPHAERLEARITADGNDIEAGPGDIVVVSLETPPKFKNVGTERLDIVCIHSSLRFIQEDFEE
jgi:mannose-6-phosphate isomerase-like protein (cupin superfamily)